MRKKLFFILILAVVTGKESAAQIFRKASFSRADTLRGTYTAERSWWDVTHYAISVKPDLATERISGNNIITYRVLRPEQRMQIDLQMPMEIDSIIQEGRHVRFEREGNAFFVNLDKKQVAGKLEKITIFYSGAPKKALNAPWNGGWVWKKDDQGNPWVTVACQGLGASVWYPNKDHQSDEPDSASMTITVPDDLVAVANGRLRWKKNDKERKLATYCWAVTNPINNYNLIPYIGKYTRWTETFQGEKGALGCTYWVLEPHLEKSKEHFKQVKQMMKCFEHWFGPYPFYEDGYQLVEAPHLGMEHQSAIAYGNAYKNGYMGSDLSGSGWGMKFDFIIIHETGHEWFGNNITTKDVADMWVHEGFTSYSEALFAECQYGIEAANAYVQGIRKNISNSSPVIGQYNVNNEGSGDMYFKGSNLVHIIRQVMNNDEKFRNMLRDMNKVYYHQTVTSAEIEAFISKYSGFDFSKVFDQYLRTVKIPELDHKTETVNEKLILSYRWTNCVEGFNMPMRIQVAPGEWKFIYPTTEWQSVETGFTPDQFKWEEIKDKNFYIK
ncbi:MAG TPA: M1 family metallopeptidase [Parasegetibacter sp.]